MTAEEVQPSSAEAMPPPPLPLNGVHANEPSEGLSAEEIAQYDRQLRLWGSEAQERIRQANILLISLRALGTEIAKNLTLAGVRSINIIDADIVTEDDLGAQYFVREEDIGLPRAQVAIPRISELNPRVTVTSSGTLNDLITPNATDFAQYQCVIACDLDYSLLSLINNNCHFSGTPFYAAGIHGFYGFIFADLVTHDFKVSRENPNIPTQVAAESLTRTVIAVSKKKETDGKMMEVVQKREAYCPLMLANSSPLSPEVTRSRRRLKQVPALLPCLRAVFEFQQTWGHLPSPQQPQELAMFTTTAQQKSHELMLPPEALSAEFLRSFIQNLGTEIVPTAAFVGGRLSEDVINVLGKREQPIQNFAIFDGDALEGKIYCLYTPPPEMSLPTGGAMLNGTGLSTNNFSVANNPMPIMGQTNGFGMGSLMSVDGSGDMGMMADGAGMPLVDAADASLDTGNNNGDESTGTLDPAASSISGEVLGAGTSVSDMQTSLQKAEPSNTDMNTSADAQSSSGLPSSANTQP